MRSALVTFLFVVMVTGFVRAQDKEVKAIKRYNVEPDLDTYPQGAPKEALGSVLRAIEQKRINYLLAQLADPEFVDNRVKTYGGNFDELVKEATDKLVNDPSTVKQLRRFLREGEWEMDETSASARIKEVNERVFFRKVEGRWYLEDRSKASTEK